MIEIIQSVQGDLTRARDLVQEVFVLTPRTDIVRDALIQRFEFTFELYRKLIKKILIHEGVDVLPGGPKTILKLGHTYGYVNDVALMIDLLECRNTFAHEYSESKIDDLVTFLDSAMEVFFVHIQHILDISYDETK